MMTVMPKDFPNALRKHCMHFVKDWQNSTAFLDKIDWQYTKIIEDAEQKIMRDLDALKTK